MRSTDQSVEAPQLDYDAWRELLRSKSGRSYSEGIEQNAFCGWVRPINVPGFTTLDIGSNACKVERTSRDVRVDGADHYVAFFLASGEMGMTYNDAAVRLSAGDVALVDAARPVTFSSDDGSVPWNTVSLCLPRETLLNYLGVEPRGGLHGRRGASIGRLLFDLIRNVDNDDASALSPADSYMKLAVYDLVGALFAPWEPRSGSRHSDKLFARVRSIINDGFADPDFGPHALAAEAGISLRYLQKLFTQRDSTCTEFIYSVRLDYAAKLLRRRDSLGTNQPLSEIGYACGFRDYTHFARKFRQRFGCPPGAHAENSAHSADGAVRSCPLNGALRAHDVRSTAA